MNTFEIVNDAKNESPVTEVLENDEIRMSELSYRYPQATKMSLNGVWLSLIHI